MALGFLFTYRLPALIFLISLLAACANIPKAPQKPPLEKDNYDYAKAHLTWLIEKELKRHRIAGVSIALVADQEIVWQQGFGYAKKTTDNVIEENVTPVTRFRTGSIAKTLNALAVMRLVEEEKLELDTPVQEYLPDFHPKSRFAERPQNAITLRNLLTHQSGLPSDLIKGMWNSQPDNFNKALDYLKNSYVAEPPNTVYAYSNLGFDVIGALIEQGSGKPYNEYMNSLLVELGMHRSTFTASPETPPVALGYHKHKPKNELSLRDVPAAGLTSTAADLARVIMLFNNRGSINQEPWLSPKSIRQIISDHSSYNPMNVGKRIGLGVFYFDGITPKSLPIIGHGGATVSHRALIKLSPHKRYGVALLANSPNASPSLHRIANKALALLHEAYKGKPAPQQHTYWPEPTQQDITTGEAIIGHYATAGGLAKVYRKGNKLKVNIAGRTLTLYQRKPGGFYYLKYKLFGLFPIKIGAWGNIGLGLRKVNNRTLLIGANTRGTTTLFGEKITPVPIPEAWKKRVGKYRLTNPLEVIDLPSGGIKIADDFLIAYATTEEGDKLQVVLLPQNDNEAIVAGIGRSLGETVVVEQLGTESEGREQLHYAELVFEKK